MKKATECIKIKMYDIVISHVPIFDTKLKLMKKTETVTDTTLYTIGSNRIFFSI